MIKNARRVLEEDDSAYSAYQVLELCDVSNWYQETDIRYSTSCRHRRLHRQVSRGFVNFSFGITYTDLQYSMAKCKLIEVFCITFEMLAFELWKR